MSGFKPPMKKSTRVIPGNNKPAPEIKPLPSKKPKQNPAKTIERRLPSKYLPPPNSPGGVTISGNGKSYSAIYDYVTLVPDNVNVKHDLDSVDLGIFLKDDNGDHNYITSYDVVDNNNVRVYGIDHMDTKKFTITIFADTGMTPTFRFE